MANKPKKVIRKTFRPSDVPNPTVDDLARATRKYREEREGKREISDYSGGAFRYFETEVPKRQIETRERGGRQSSFRDGIWLATLQIIEDHPDFTSADAWDAMNDVELDQWTIELDRLDGTPRTEGELWQIYDGRDVEKRRKKDYLPIKYEAFRKGYFRKAKKELPSTGD